MKTLPLSRRSAVQRPIRQPGPPASPALAGPERARRCRAPSRDSLAVEAPPQRLGPNCPSRARAVRARCQCEATRRGHLLLVKRGLRTQWTPTGSGWAALTDLSAASCVWPASMRARSLFPAPERSGPSTQRSRSSQFHRFPRDRPLEVSGAPSSHVRSRSKRLPGRTDHLEGVADPHFDSPGDKRGAAGYLGPFQTQWPQCPSLDQPQPGAQRGARYRSWGWIRLHEIATVIAKDRAQGPRV